MRKYESYDTCAKCGQMYGEHAWKNDACPVKFTTVFGVAIPYRFCWFKRFKPVKGATK